VDLRAGLDDLENRKFLTLPGLELRYDNNKETHLAVCPSDRDRLREEIYREYANIAIATIVFLLSMYGVRSSENKIKKVVWFVSPF
jgi:hypothetical protein